VKRTLFALLLIVIALPALAWGEKGHYLSNEAATFGLPNDMPQFFYRSFADIVYLAYDPDRWRGAGESLDAANPPDHYLDYEWVAGLGPLSPNRYKYIALLGSSGTLRKHRIYNDTVGFLPWRIAELTQMLEQDFRQWRNARDPRDRRFIERDIVNVAGLLGHYVADGANPHHATINHNGWTGVPNPNRYPIDCDTHGRFESEFVSHTMEIADVTPRLAPPQLRTDYFATAVDEVKGSNALVERLYQLDRDGAFDVMRPIKPEGKEFAAQRLAVGASLLRDLWWSAWRNSANRPPRRQPAD
jgi:hypothetical protein